MVKPTGEIEIMVSGVKKLICLPLSIMCVLLGVVRLVIPIFEHVVFLAWVLCLLSYGSSPVK